MVTVGVGFYCPITNVPDVKLKLWNMALDDCQVVLKLEPNNLKGNNSCNFENLMAK